MTNRKLSDHLTWKELACKDGTAYPQEFIEDKRVFKLAEVFENIRFLCGSRPIKILSAYRTPEWNKRIGGARNSQHVLGRALDLQPPAHLSVGQFYDLIKSNAKAFGITGIGRYATFVHVDIRVGNHLALWSGSGIKDSRSK